MWGRATSSRAAGGLVLLAVVGAAAAWSSLPVPQPSARAAGSASDGTPAIANPARRKRDAPPPPPPQLAARADRIEPMTLQIRLITSGANGTTHTMRQTVSRTVDRVHVSSEKGAEWFFERNTRDIRRVSAYRVEHTARTIVAYSDSDVRNELALPGWGRVLTFGFDPSAVVALQASGESHTVDGVRFARYVARTADAIVPEVWWSSEHVLPARLVTRERAGLATLTIDHIRKGVDVDLVQPPALRFPAYRLVDLADWHEQH